MTRPAGVTTIIRSEGELLRIRDYVAANPARWHDDAEHPSRAPT